MNFVPLLVAALALTGLTAAIGWWWAMLLKRQLKRSEMLHTQQQQAAAKLSQQELLRLSQERDQLLNALSDAFLLIDAEGVVIFANSAARNLFGTRNLVGRPVTEILLDPRLLDPLQACRETGERTTSRVVFSQQTSPRGDQETRGDNAWTIDAAPMTRHHADAPAIRLLIRDVTTEYQTEQVRKDFVANASHELRTPMAIIGGYLENLLDDHMTDDPAMTRKFLAIMRKHADRITRIVDDMLVIAKLESGEAAALKVEPFRFASCINDVLERLESVIRDRRAQVVTLMPDPTITLVGDRFYWTQVLFNLVENALKQNLEPGLRIEIGCELVHLAATQHGPARRCHRIWVADNGVGIPSADLPHIFRRFYRVEKHHSQQEIKGTGLGLSIVKRAVEAHHGTISVDSVPGRQTRFLIHLPAPLD